MRNAVVLLCVMLGAAAPLAALDAFPKTTLAEDATSTGCPYCPDAYDGLEVVHSAYNYGEFVSARYYSSAINGQYYYTPETMAAIAYYDIGSYPTVVFNGQTMVVGGGDAVASGAAYLPIVQAASFEPAPIRIEIDSFDPATGDIQATVTMYSSSEVLAGDHVRFVLTEDNVAGDHTRVTRDIISPSPTIALSGVGNTAVFTQSFDIDPGWNQANLHAVVFVQRAGDKEVLQAASTYPTPDYSVRAMVPFDRVKVGPSSGTYTSPYFTIANMGFTDTFTINLIVDEGPPGWVASYCDDHGTCHVGEYSFDLAAGASTEFDANVTPDSPGYMRYHFEITSPNLASTMVIPFTYLTDDLDVLIVDDDGSDDYESYYTAALDTLGFSYGVWDRAAARLTPDVLQAYPLLIWQVGLSYPTLDADDRVFLTEHLDNGGSLFLTGQDIGWELNTEAPAWYHDYLHANYIRDDTNIYYLNGVAGDPISDGLVLHIQGGDGANNQAYPDEIAPRDSTATQILAYQGDGGGAIRSSDPASGARVVYLGFGYEAIDNPQDRADLLGAALLWMWAGDLFSDDFESGDTSRWSVTVP
jgi:hypothetical protein